MKKRIAQILSLLPIIGWVFNRYESAWQGWGERSWVQQSLQDARFDIDAATRQEIQRRHRYWVSNSPLIQKLRSLRIQFVVGPCGLQCIPNSGNEQWNDTRHNSFETWAHRPDISSNHSLRQCTAIWAGQDFDDGEFFILKTRDEFGRPAIQTIEAHRICNPPKQNSYQGMPIIDGCALDKNGRTAFYAVKVGAPMPPAGYDPSAQPFRVDDGSNFVFVKASDMIHKFESLRPGQLRGIPKGFSCLNDLHDVSDLHKLEMQCAKIAAEIGVVETNPSGELDATMNRRNRLAIQTTNQNGQGVSKAAWADYNVSFGGKKYALKSGDKLENFMVNRPTVSQSDYWSWKISEICAGYDTAVLLAFPFAVGKIQGTAVRAELDICANAFRKHFERIREALEEIYQWQGVWANDFDLSQDGKYPDDHAQVVIRPPRSPNVDIGYTAKALEIELSLGVKTIQDVYAEKQQNWRVQLRQIAETQAYVKELAAEFGIDAAQITKLAVEHPEAEPKSSGNREGEGDSTEAQLNHQANA